MNYMSDDQLIDWQVENIPASRQTKALVLIDNKDEYFLIFDTQYEM